MPYLLGRYRTYGAVGLSALHGSLLQSLTQKAFELPLSQGVKKHISQIKRNKITGLITIYFYFITISFSTFTDQLNETKHVCSKRRIQAHNR